MSRAEAWGDAGEIIKQYSAIVSMWPFCQAIALRTSLTEGEADAKLLSGVQGLIGELLYEFGDYGEGEDG